VIGRLDFAGSGVKNVSKMRCVGGQWIIDAKGKLDIVVTHNGTAPEIPVQRTFELLGA
jgi:branched-chain amino acid transport system substrate-binding protein